MRNNISAFLISVAMLCCSKQSGIVSVTNVPVKNPHFLDGLRKMSDTGMNSAPIDGKKDPVSFYTPNGIRIPQIDVYKNAYSGNYQLESYVNDSNRIKAVVVLFMPESKKKQLDLINQNKGKPSPLLNKKAVPFDVTDIRNKRFTEDQPGKIIVLNFWFIACKPCVQEIPELNKLTKKYSKKKVIFLSFTPDKKEKLIPFLREHPFNYHIIPEKGEISKKYLVASSPTHIIIDRESTIRYYHSGAFDDTTIQVFEKEIDKILEK